MRPWRSLRNLDPDFEFISSAAPLIPEVKGTSKYLADEVDKLKRKFPFF